jgi:hypothetical protein
MALHFLGHTLKNVPSLNRFVPSKAKIARAPLDKECIWSEIIVRFSESPSYVLTGTRWCPNLCLNNGTIRMMATVMKVESVLRSVYYNFSTDSDDTNSATSNKATH